MRVLFIDPFSSEAYTPARLRAGALGGTEATAVRVAEGLAQRGYCVTIAQSKRHRADQSSNGVCYVPFDGKRLATLPAADAVVVLRAPKLLPMLRRFFPEAGLFLWLHCYQGKHRKWLNAVCVQNRVTIIAVSETHARWIRAYLHRYRDFGRSPSLYQFAPVETCYNVVDHRIRQRNRRVDPNKLIFFSSPHKGLEEVLSHFTAVSQFNPDARLFLANPGYIDLDSRLHNGKVKVLGALPQEEVLHHVAEAFCVFYPQTRFAETFGLVFAEANKVGTPVLSHDIGSAREVLGSEEQIVDASCPSKVVARLEQWWRDGRPRVSGRPEFSLPCVLDKWERVLRSAV